MSASEGPSIDAPRAVRQGENLDTAALTPLLRDQLGLEGDVVVEQFPGGHSNLTYLLTIADRQLVLRRPPFGSKVKSAHDMGREYRVLSKLSRVFDKAPKPLLHCDDEAVLGCEFYIMEPIRGLILRREPPAGMTLGPDTASALCESLIDTLAELHTIDYRAAGLGDLGRPAGYIERQVAGWTKRYAGSKTDDIGAVDRVAQWLASNKPDEVEPALIHNDFKFDNIVLDPNEPTRVIGILDWEMTTVGDPLMDVGTALCYWVEAGDPEPAKQSRFGPTTMPGMWTRSQLWARYCERTGRKAIDPLFYYVFGLFKTAVVVQQIYYRFAQGLTTDPRFGKLIGAVRVLSQLAVSAIERHSIDAPPIGHPGDR